MPYRPARTPRHPWRNAALFAVILATIVAGIVTLIDWVINPDGVFHGGLGTDWGVVWQTWSSWFLPALAVIAVITFAVTWWQVRGR